MLVDFGIFFVIAGMLVIGAVVFSAALASRRRQQRFGSEEPGIPVNLASVSDGVLVAGLGGQIVFANETARAWFGVETGDPDLWRLAQTVSPPEAFLELFAAEGQASFSLGERNIEAASHRVAVGASSQFIVIMREEAPLPTLDREERGSTRALQVIGEIVQAINASLNLSTTLRATLEGVSRVLPADASQISLWDAEGERLQPRFRLGPETYCAALPGEGEPGYAPDEGLAGWIARKRRPLLIENLAAGSPEAQPAPRPGDPAFNSYLGVPLTVRNRFIGTLELMSAEAGRFDREDQALLVLLAEQAAIAIENARQYNSQAERVAELSGLQKIAQAISVLRDPYQLFDQLGQRVAELMQTESAGVLLYDREQEKLIAQKPLYGVPDGVTADYQISLEKGSPARSLWEDVSFWFSNNVPEDRLVEEMGFGMLAEMTAVRSTAMVAMTVGEERIGVLQVSNKIDGTPFTMEDIRLLQIYADQAAIVVESARLYAEEQSRVAELRGLQQISQALSAFTNPDELYGQLTERIASLMGVDVCGLLLYDPDGEQLTARHPFYGMHDEIVENYIIPLRRGLAREMWREDELWESNHVMTDERIDGLGLREIARAAGLRTVLFAPLSAGGRRFGMLQVANKSDGSEFDDGDKRLVTIFAGQAATLIDNARLYQDTDATLRKRAAELRSVSRISRELNATLELERILEVIATEALRAEGARWGNLVMFEWDEAGTEPRDRMRFGTEVGEEAQIIERACARSGETVVVDDFKKLPHYPSPLPEARSALVVPIQFEGRVVGVISLYANKPGGLGASAAEYVQALSSQATIAVTNATRHAEQVERSELLRRRAEQLTQIFELGRVFRSDQSIEDALESVARAIRESAGFQIVVLSALDSAGQALRHISQMGLSPALARKMSQKLVAWEVVQRYLSDEYRISGSYLIPRSDSKALIGALGLVGTTETLGKGQAGRWQPGDVLLIPLRSTSDEIIGLLTVDQPRDNAIPNRNTVELLEIFANQAAIALENSRLYRSVEDRAADLSRSLSDLERSYQELDKLSQEMIRKDAELSQANDLLALRAQRLLALHRVMESVDASRGPQAVLQNIASSVVEEMDVDQCLIALGPPDGKGPLDLVAAEGRLPRGFEAASLIDGKDPLSTTYSSERPVIFAPGSGKNSRGAAAQAARTLGVQTLVTLPMRLDRARGVLLVGSTRPGAAFDDDDRDLFNLLASQIVVEYENARLYQAVQSEAATAAAERDRLQQLHVITTALQQTRDLGDRLAVIARGIRSVGWGKVIVALVDPITLEVGDLVSAGYSADEEAAFSARYLKGQPWRDYLADPEFITLRVGSSYLLAADSPWFARHLPEGAVPATDSPSTAWLAGDQLVVPMYAGSEIIGLINLREPTSGQRPDAGSLRPLELFIQQASSALENVRLYQSTLELQSYTDAVVQSIQQGIIVTDRNGRVETINEFLRQNFGWTDDMIGQDLFATRGTLHDMGFLSDFARVIDSGQPVERANVIYPVRDEARTINVYLYPRYDETREVNGVVILMEDTTTRSRLEADIAQRGQQLAALSEASRQITATLSVADVVDSALAQAADVIAHDQIAIWLRSEEGDRLTVAGARGFADDEGMKGLSVDLDEVPLFAEIARSLTPIIRDDQAADVPPGPGGVRSMRSWLGAPMVSGNILLGMLVFEKVEAHAYAPADGQIAAAFASQAAVALENARLFEEASERAVELSRRTRRLALINRVSSTLGGSLDQISILQTVINELAQAIGAAHSSALMVEPDGATARLVVQYPSNPDGSVDDLRIPARGHPLFERLRDSHDPLVVEDVAASPLTVGFKEVAARYGYRASLFLPVAIGSQLAGILTIDVEDPHDLDPDQIELAQTILNQAAVAVQNAQLFQETVVRRAELGILLEAGRIASASLDLDTVVSNTVRYFIRSLGADGCTVALLDRSQNALITLAEHTSEGGARPLTPADHRSDLTDYPVTASVLESGNALTLDASNPGLTVAEAQRLGTRGCSSALLLPLQARDETVGLVEVWSIEPRQFTTREIELARALSTSVSSAMENARLHDETQRRLSQLAIINELSHALTQTISTEDLYQILQSQMSDLLGMHSMTVAQRDALTGQVQFPLAVRKGLRIHIDPIGYGADLYSIVIETQKPLHIPRDVPGKLKELGVDHIEPGLKSFLAVPLLSGEKVVGVLAVEDYERENAFSEADLRVLSPIAAQVATSIENARLYSELEQRLSETTTLQEVSRVVNSALDLKEIFTRVVTELANAFRYPLIGLFTLEGTELVLQAHHGYEPDEVRRLSRLPAEAGIVGRAALSGQPQFVPDVARDQDYLPVKGWVRCEIAVPIIADRDVLGVLNVQSGLENPLDAGDMNLLRTFASQVATAMTNARLFTQMVNLSAELEQRVEERTRELKEERDRIDTLYRIAVELTASLDLDRVLNRALELVGEAVGAEHGSLFLIDPLSERLIWRAVMSSNEILPPGGRQIMMTRHEGMAGWVMDNRHSIRVDNVQLDPRWINAPGTEHNRSLLGAPLIANEEVLGCIFFTSDEENVFHDGHVRLVEAAANQVANSINNAELYRLIRDQAERLGVMLRSQQTEAAKSQAILESVADGVMVSDQAGEIILFNAAAERILELRRADLLGRSSADLSGLYGTGAEKWTEMLRSWSANPSRHAGEYLSEQIAIGNKVVAVNVAPVLHGDEFLGVVSVFRDITREVAADRIKSEFVATVSHELRTPMTSIKGYADLLLLGAAGEITPEQRRFLEIVKNNADRLSLLVNDLLDISRIEQGHVELDLQPVDLREVIQDVMQSLEGRRDNEQRELTFIIDVPDDLPSVQADFDRVTQILLNLMSNAYNYTPDGGKITVRARSEADGVNIDVSDTGIGIPKEAQERVFQRFFRGEDQLVMKTAGTGLGLSIVQHLVTMHHGRVTFESEEGVGTTFTVWLPCQANGSKPG